jgi:hypothetical protein
MFLTLKVATWRTKNQKVFVELYQQEKDGTVERFEYIGRGLKGSFLAGAILLQNKYRAIKKLESRMKGRKGVIGSLMSRCPTLKRV